MFLSAPDSNEATSALYARDLADDGYVGNLTRLWARRPDVFNAFLSVRTLLTEKAALSLRDRALLVCATAAAVGDSYCALAWGAKPAAESDPATAAAVLRRKKADALSAREEALVAPANSAVARSTAADTAEAVQRRD